MKRNWGVLSLELTRVTNHRIFFLPISLSFVLYLQGTRAVAAFSACGQSQLPGGLKSLGCFAGLCVVECQSLCELRSMLCVPGEEAGSLLARVALQL